MTTIPPGQTVEFDGGNYDLVGDIVVQGTLIFQHADLRAVSSNGDARSIDVQGGTFEFEHGHITTSVTDGIPHLAIDAFSGGQVVLGDSFVFSTAIDLQDGSARLVGDVFSDSETQLDGPDGALIASGNRWTGQEIFVDSQGGGTLAIDHDDFGPCLAAHPCVFSHGGVVNITASTFRLRQGTVSDPSTGFLSRGASFMLVDNNAFDDGDPLTHGFHLGSNAEGQSSSGSILGGEVHQLGEGVYFEDHASDVATTISGVNFFSNTEDVHHA